jgi:hypothetical protein
VRLAFCWAHVRRRFYELAVAGPAPIASEALKRIVDLYAVETHAGAAAPMSGARFGRRRAAPFWKPSNPGCVPSST